MFKNLLIKSNKVVIKQLVCYKTKKSNKSIVKRSIIKGLMNVNDPDAIAWDKSAPMVEEYVKSIDTTLTKEQQEYVDQIKKKIIGTSRARSPYRNVPLPEERDQDSVLVSMYPPNADALIDYALSHIPRRGGPRRSNAKKRYFNKLEVTRWQHAKKKDELRDAAKRKLEKRKKQNILIQQYKLQAKEINSKKSLTI
mmetsp:Transcript_21937/g.19958  ORF Transcript_21937/g.19958 Transcript_21937/m.19958 type:complete len:196 (+) Transcript_21937:95-682(+)